MYLYSVLPVQIHLYNGLSVQSCTDIFFIYLVVYDIICKKNIKQIVYQIIEKKNIDFYVSDNFFKNKIHQRAF